MKVPVHDKKAESKRSVNLPKQFDTPLREDLIRRAVAAAWKNRVQPYGHKKLAGRRSSAVFSGVRRGYGHSYNWGVARVPRLMIRGGRRVGKVVNVPQAVGGPRVHGPTAERKWSVRLNQKERRLAIRSAIAATADINIVTKRGHKVGDKFPLVLEGIEDLKKTKEVIDLLIALGLSAELERASVKKVRAGRGTSRGRTYKKAKGPLIVVSKVCPLIKAANNIPGVNIVAVNQLNAESLAPGAHPGRLTLYTAEALEKMEKENLFF